MESNFDNYYYREIANLTGAGGWSVDFKNKKTFLDPAARQILMVPDDFKLTPKNLLNFYAEGEHQEKAVNYFIHVLQNF